MSGLSNKQKSPTVIGDFQRQVRDEPLHYIFKHRVWVERDSVPESEIMAWLRDRYVGSRAGHRYRVRLYKATDGMSYVDQVLLETFSAKDQVFFKLQWGYTDHRVQRGNRVAKRRLNPEQRVRLNELIQKVEDDFYDNLGIR